MMPMPRCDFCTEVACETSAMECAQCSGQTCGSQCTVSQCSTAQCGQCGIAETGCGPQCFQCGTCESCQGCQSLCQSCQGCQGSCESTCENSAQGPTSAGTITSITSTATTITIRYTSISKAVWYQVVYKVGSSGTLQYIANGSSLTCKITGLEPNTLYTVNYRGATATEFGPLMATGRTISTTSNRPSSWAWWSTVSADKPIDISASEWSAFCTRINEFRDYVGLPQYGAFVAVKSGMDITATIVNHAVWAIQAMNSGAQSLEVDPGDIISASFFNGLKNYLNGIT